MLVPQLNTRGEVIGYVEQAPNVLLSRMVAMWLTFFDSGTAVVVDQGKQSWVM
jgi:hypothetical protein